MKAVNFPEANVKIAENQPEYKTLPACVVGDKAGRIITCFELDDKEILEVVATKRIWHCQLTGNSYMQPILMDTQSPFEEEKEYDTNIAAIIGKDGKVYSSLHDAVNKVDGVKLSNYYFK